MKDDENSSKRSSLRLHWTDLLALYHELKVCRFSLIVAGVGAVIFLGVPQGVELLRSLGEESTFDVLGSGPSAGIKWTAIVFGTLAWSVASWYTCRILLYFRFPGQESEKKLGRLWKWLGPRLRTYLPRLLGSAPMVIMALGFWHASTTYADAKAEACWWLRLYAGFCVLIAIVLYLLFTYRPGKEAVRAFERSAGTKGGGFAQRSVAIGQRGANGQPGGGSIMFGGDPSMPLSRCWTKSRRGVELSRPAL